MDTMTINDVHTNYCIILTNSSVTGHTFATRRCDSRNSHSTDHTFSHKILKENE
jgi:hypothetical protein